MTYLKYYLRTCPLSTLEVLISGINEMPASSLLETLRSIITHRLGNPMVIDISDATEDDWEALAVKAIRSGFALPMDATTVALNDKWQDALIREISDTLSRSVELRQKTLKCD